LDLARVELAVHRIAVEVLDQELHLPAQHGEALELEPAAERDLRLPVVLLEELEVGPEDRAQAPRKGPWAPQLEPALHVPRRVVRGLDPEDIAAATVEAEPVPGLVRDPGVHALVAEIDAVRVVVNDLLVAEVRAAVEHARDRRPGAVSDGAEPTYDVVE